MPKEVADFIPFQDVWNNYVYLDDNKVIGITDLNGCMTIVDVTGFREIATVPLREGSLPSIVPYTSGRYFVSTGTKGFIDIVDTKTLLKGKGLKISQQPLFSMATRKSDNLIAVAGENGTIYILKYT